MPGPSPSPADTWARGAGRQHPTWEELHFTRSTEQQNLGRPSGDHWEHHGDQQLAEQEGIRGQGKPPRLKARPGAPITKKEISLPILCNASTEAALGIPERTVSSWPRAPPAVARIAPQRAQISKSFSDPRSSPHRSLEKGHEV